MNRGIRPFLLLIPAMWGCMSTDSATEPRSQGADTVSADVRASLDSLLPRASVEWSQPLQDIAVIFDPTWIGEPDVDTTIPSDCIGPYGHCTVDILADTTTLKWDFTYSGGTASFLSSPALDSILEPDVSETDRTRLAKSLFLTHRSGFTYNGGKRSEFSRSKVGSRTDETFVNANLHNYVEDSEIIHIQKTPAASGWAFYSWSSIRKSTSKMGGPQLSYGSIAYEAVGQPFVPAGPQATGEVRATWKASVDTFMAASLRFGPTNEFVEALEARNRSGFDSVWMTGTRSDSIRWTTFARKGDTTRLGWHRPDLRSIRLDSLYVHKGSLSGGRWKECTVNFTWDSTIANPLGVGVVSRIRFEGVRQTGQTDRLEGRVLLGYPNLPSTELTWSELRILDQN